jgi:GTPase Era involved in 16S rRNA processing
MKKKIIFEEGCFDEMDDLTQEEIDNLVSTLQQKLDDGTFFDEAVQLSDEEAETIFADIERKKLNRAPRQ